MDDHAIQPSPTLVSVAESDEQSHLPPYPQLLLEATISELFAGDLELSGRLWRRLLDYQQRLLTASFKRLGNRWRKSIVQFAKRADSDFEIRQETVLWCLDTLGKQSLLAFCYATDQLANIYRDSGDPDQAQRQTDIGRRVLSLFDLQAEPILCKAHTNSRPIPVNGNAAKLAIYRFLPNGTLITEYESETTAAFLTLDQGSLFTSQTEIDLPAHRLELFERIGNELLSGDPESAKTLWSDLVASQTKLTRDCIRLLVSDSRFEDAHRAQVVTRLESLTNLYPRTCTRLYVKLAEILVSDQRLEEARELLRLSYELADVVKTRKQTSVAVIADQNESESSNVTAPPVASPSTLVEFVEGHIRQMEAQVNWEIDLKDLLDRRPLDVAALIAFCERISNEFSSASRSVQGNLVSTLLSIFVSLKTCRSNLDRLDRRDEILGLSWALYYVNKALRNRISYRHDEQAFNDCYEFHNSVRLESSINSIPEIRDDLTSTLEKARTIANNLLEDSRFLDKLEKQPKLSNFFFSRLGEIYRAHSQYECATGAELQEILEYAISCFLRCLTSREDPLPLHKAFLYPRLAECLSLAGRYTEAIEYHKALLQLDQASRMAKWESTKLIAQCLLDIAQEIKRDQEHDGIDVSQYYAEAEGWLIEAANIWEAGADLTARKCANFKNSPLHYHLGTLYTAAAEYERATQQLRWALEWATHERYAGGYQNYRDLLTYLLAESLVKEDQIDEAVHIVKELVERGVAPAYRVRTLLLLKKLYVLQQNEEAVRTTTEVLLATAQTEQEHFVPLAETDQQIFLSFAEMNEFVLRCRKLLETGEVRMLVHQLPTLVAASKSLWFSRQPDPVLLELLASAYMEIGQFDTALAHLRSALAADSSDKNQGICWLKIGELRKRQGKMSEAAKAFEHSYTFGNNLGALLMAANAHRRAGNYAKSLEYVEHIRNSGVDKSPKKTNTEAALTLWYRYCDSTPGVGGDENDVVSACKYLDGILRGVFGRAGDRVAALQLATMIEHPKARQVLINLMRTGPLPTQLALLNKLTFLHIHNRSFVDAAIRLLPRKVHPDNKPLFIYRPVAKYIIATWIEAYLTKDRVGFAKVVRDVTRKLLERTTDEVFWWTLLARNRGTMGAIVRMKLYEELSAILLDHVHKGPEEFLTHLRDVALPRLRSHLETGLFGLSPSAYAGREVRSSLFAELNQILGTWLLSNKIDHCINSSLSYDEAGQDYGVTQLQIEIAASLLNHLHGELETSFHNDPLQLISLRVENASKCVLVKLRIALASAVSQPQYEEFCRRFVALPVLQNWRSATRRLLPQPIVVKLRPARKDLEITLSLWPSKLPARDEWPGYEFYSLVVETPNEETKTDEYYEATQEKIGHLLQSYEAKLPDYILSQLDGVFAQVYRTSRLSLESVPHTIKNVLRHLDNMEFGDVEELGKVAIGIKKLSELILQGGPVVMKDFDLRETLKQILDECRIFYPDVSFEFTDISNGELIASASRGHVVVAIWDVIHNNVDAVRRLEEGTLRLIRLFVLRTNEGLEIVIANTGPPTTKPSERGFGIGSKNVRQTIQKHHYGKVDHGAPIYNKEPFNYEWRLLLPLNSPSRRRPNDV